MYSKLKVDLAFSRALNQITCGTLLFTSRENEILVLPAFNNLATEQTAKEDCEMKLKALGKACKKTFSSDFYQMMDSKVKSEHLWSAYEIHSSI